MFDIPTTDLVAQLHPCDGLPLDPQYWWANAVRGAVGASLRFMLCRVRGTPCTTCSERPSCVFPSLFQPERYAPHEGRGPRYRLAPWVLWTDLQEGLLVAHLRLFGPAAPHAWRWRTALELAAARGIGRGRRAFVPASLELRESTFAQLLPLCPPAGAPLLVRFCSPLRLVTDGKPAAVAPSFAALLLAVHRRLRLAQLCWSEVTPSAPPQAPPSPSDVPLMAHAVAWQEYSRYSRRQQRAMRLGGVTGEAVYGGDWASYWPLLATAAVLHAGKLTTMGFGRVEFSSA